MVLFCQKPHSTFISRIKVLINQHLKQIIKFQTTLYKRILKIILFVFKKKKPVQRNQKKKKNNTRKMYIESILIILDALSDNG